jgi:glutamine synthetase
MSFEERERRQIGLLPGSLFEAIQLTKKSNLVREALGEHLFNSFIKNKEVEWNRYRTYITDYELKNYLSIL